MTGKKQSSKQQPESAVQSIALVGGASLIEVEIDAVSANSYNPNVMDPVKFDMLAEDVAEQGMDQPVVVREDPEHPGCYVIVDGEHRWRSAKAAGHETILVSVKPWDSSEAKLQTVRRNLLRGSLDPVRMTALVRDVEKEMSLDMNEVRKRMGFATEKEFARVYREEAPPPIDEAMAALESQVEEADRDLSLVSELVRTVIMEFGDAVKSGTICFVIPADRERP